MPCFYPQAAYRTESGSVVFAERRSLGGSVATLTLPCGQCVGCRLERSRQWATRCMHEASLYDQNCFITLTYDDVHVPQDLSLRYSDFQSFMKRLRSRFFSSKIRFYMCGEYGEGLSRPHYHALLFNCGFPDQLYFKRVGEFKLYTSGVLRELWPLGHHLIGSATFESAAYCARYCVTKVTGKDAERHYQVVDPETGEIINRVPEFNKMSLRPGIGEPWFRRFWRDVYPRGEVVVRGKYATPPRYYDNLYKRIDSTDEFAAVELKRYQRAARLFSDNTAERLAVKEQVAIARLSSMQNRSL